MPASLVEARGSGSGRAIKRRVAIVFFALYLAISAVLFAHGLEILSHYGAGIVAAIAGLWSIVGVALMLVYRVIGRHIRILERERARAPAGIRQGSPRLAA